MATIAPVRRSARFLALIPAALILACGDGGGGTTPTEPSITISGAVQAGGLMNVRAAGVMLAQSQYDATLGGAQIVLARMDDSTLVAYVPDMAAGTHALNATLGSRTLNASVNVAAARTIANPVAHVNQALDEQVAAYDVAAPLEIPQAEWDADRAAFLNAVQNARDVMATLTPDEQLAAARFLEALEEALAPLLASGTQTGQYLVAAELTCNQAAAAAFISGVTWFAGVGSVVAGTFVPGVNLIVIPVGAAIVWKAHSMVRKDLARMWAVCDKQKSVGLGGSSGGSMVSAFQLGGSDAVIEGGSGRALGGVTSYQPAAAEELSAAGSQSSAARISFVRKRPVRTYPTQGLQAFSTSHIAGNSQLTRLSATLDKAWAAIADLPGWVRTLLPVPPRLSTVGEKPIVTTSLGPDSVRIGTVTQGVSITSRTDGNALVLTADAPGTNERQFTFELISTRDANVRTTMDGILRTEDIVTLQPLTERVIGTWTVNEQAGTVTLACRMEWRVTITGTNPVHLSSMSHVITSVAAGVPPVTGSESYPPNSYGPGTVDLWGRWWWTWPVGTNTADFYVGLLMGYRNNVTGETGSSNGIEMLCTGLES